MSCARVASATAVCLSETRSRQRHYANRCDQQCEVRRDSHRRLQQCCRERASPLTVTDQGIEPIATPPASGLTLSRLSRGNSGRPAAQKRRLLTLQSDAIMVNAGYALERGPCGTKLDHAAFHFCRRGIIESRNGSEGCVGCGRSTLLSVSLSVADFRAPGAFVVDDVQSLGHSRRLLASGNSQPIGESQLDRF